MLAELKISMHDATRHCDASFSFTLPLSIATTMSIKDCITIEELADFKRVVLSDDQISKCLQRRHPGMRGLSGRSVRRLRQEWGITTTTTCTDEQVDAMVAVGIEEVRSMLFVVTISLISIFFRNSLARVTASAH